ncbi:MAG: flagellar hook-basal body protein [Verrucomicrobia bacterium]|jgi:flagellar basal-body rod protein FlgF|nr:flagellar hook-basal body protein [Verrucomicrobiota bacterium]
MNIGLYQSAASLSALERWQDAVSQNITSSQNAGYRKRTINFSAEFAGELQIDPKGKIGRDSGVASVFPKTNAGISFVFGEMQPTRRELDVSIQGDGFFAIQRPDGSKVYTRSGEFRMRPDRTIVTSGGDLLMSSTGTPMLLTAAGGPVTINPNGTIVQGSTPVGRIGIQKFADNAQLRPISGGFFVAPEGVEPEAVDKPELLQGFIEGSNTSSLREMVDLVLISRAYEANQKIIGTVDQQMEKTLQALG